MDSIILHIKDINKMIWIMSGWDKERKEVVIEVKAKSMDEAFKKARKKYKFIVGAQPKKINWR